MATSKESKHVKSVARVYPDINQKRPPEYSDYENHVVQWGGQDDYEIICKVGRGKDREGVESMNVRDNEKCIIKVLKPVRDKKIRYTLPQIILHPWTAELQGNEQFLYSVIEGLTSNQSSIGAKSRSCRTSTAERT